MKRFQKVTFLAFWIFILNHSNLLATHVRGGFITATVIDNNNLTYRIALNSFIDTGSTVAFGGGLMDFGDGSDPVLLEPGNPDVSKLLDEEVAMEIFYMDHSFPGPGAYIISYREFNRNAGIANMDNSVNTPFYIETRIMIDPYLGANSSIKINNYFPFKNNTNQPYIFPLSITDLDEDSISVESFTPLQDKDTPVSNYFVPANYDGIKILSQLQLHTPSNEIVWANPLEEDEYNYAVKIREWRYNVSENTWLDMGYTLFDFQIIVIDRIDKPPVILNLKDSVVLYSNPFEEEFTILEDNADSVRVWVSGNLPYHSEFSTTINQELYHPTPLKGKISVLNTANLLRSDPYKIVVSMNPKQFNSTSSQKSTMFWITDHSGKPSAPSGLKAELAFNNTIIISWQDLSDEEAGYIIERADSFFPDFIRIAALPENTIQLVDENVIPNRDYYYRVKALGSEGSAHSEVLIIKEEEIITGIKDPFTYSGITIYPNPVEDQLFIQYDSNMGRPEALEIFDTTGRIHQRTEVNCEINDAELLTIPATNLFPGLYFIRMDLKDNTYIKKFLKN